MRLAGRSTRGKTAPNRLRKTDAFLALAYPERVRGMRGWYVDVGFGATPVTSVETLRRLRRLEPGLRVLGVEIDPARVAAARAFAAPGLEFRLGGFDLPLPPGERAGVVRAFNVLRQYDEGAVADALRRLGASLAPDGLLLEGTSDPTGRLLTFGVHERRDDGLARTRMVLAPTVSDAFAPRQLQAVLPKRVIHHAEPGGAVDRFFGVWAAAWQASRRWSVDPARRFAIAAAELAARGYPVDRRPALLRRGFLVLGAAWPLSAAEMS